MTKRKRKAVGENTSARLGERDGLRKRTLPGGGTVWQGELATEALEVMDARAMTLDQSIIVSEDFDYSRPEDAALYAHEQFHIDQGDHSAGGHHIHSAEEVSARAVEGMVLHRAATGGGEAAPSPGGGSSGGGQKPQEPKPMAGYNAMVKEGLNHLGVVDELTRFVMTEMDTAEALNLARNKDHSNWR
jgi:hypothetical protein